MVETTYTRPDIVVRLRQNATHSGDSRMIAAEEIEHLRIRVEAAEARAAELEAENAKLRRFAENAANYRESAHDYDRDAGYPERAFDDEEEWDRLESMARAALAAKEGS